MIGPQKCSTNNDHRARITSGFLIHGFPVFYCAVAIIVVSWRTPCKLTANRRAFHGLAKTQNSRCFNHFNDLVFSVVLAVEGSISEDSVRSWQAARDANHGRAWAEEGRLGQLQWVGGKSRAPCTPLPHKSVGRLSWCPVHRRIRSPLD